MATYLITGNTNRQINDSLKKIVSNNEYETYDAINNDLKTILENNSVNSLFSEQRIVVVKNADYFGSKSKDASILEAYLKDEVDDLLLIFITDQKIDSRKKIVKVLRERNALIECPVLSVKDIVNIIGNDFNNDGYKVTQEILYYIVNSSMNNYDLVLNEVEKIKIYYNGGCVVNFEDVKNIVIPSVENNVFKLIDAVVNHQIVASFKIYNDLKILKEEPIKILNLLAREYRLILLCGLYKRKQMSSFEISKKLALQPWQIDKYVSLITKYSTLKLKKILAELANIDFSIKSGKCNKHLALEMFILKHC